MLTKPVGWAPVIKGPEVDLFGFGYVTYTSYPVSACTCGRRARNRLFFGMRRKILLYDIVQFHENDDVPKYK